ncbi:major outer membrane protein [Aliarcobacter butzleri]|uniref:porin n=1 Tax=Aliarcobacter butzleri TaxID=28197 RepID=UPI001EDF5055|nr:major outer membrane protein [Aliarcobacter butzleri]MCG3699161.1 major outer membrane protein [Aliarcobacter butzleri]MDN5082782.1 major outer membrane protein [Aliarcobacter butzleri]MDN5084958.1 major outer membrane protein [Aliarcobacter butzleri]
MRKISKLSLVAAVAVAGFSTANAQPLEEAIKNVEVSGSVVYRYNDYNNDSNDAVTAGEGHTQTNNYKIGLNLSSKVNDYVKFNSRFLVAGEDAGFASLDSGKNNDQNVDVTLSHAYFGLTAIPNTTVNVGKQGLATPWTVALDSDGNEQTGTGVLALTTVGPVTAAAGYFNQTNLDKSTDAKIPAGNVKGQLAGTNDVVVGALIADLSPVTLDAWYLDLDETFDTYTIGAKSDFKFDGGKVGIDARYVSLTLDKAVADALTNGEEDNAIAKVAITGNLSIFNAKVAYANTDKKGGLTALDQDAEATLLGWNITANGKVDADYWQAVLGVNVLDNLNLSANYGNIQYKVDNDTSNEVEEEEIYAQLTYKMSKNLNTYVRYGTYTKENKFGGSDKDINDDLRGRLQVEYTF